MIQSLLLKRLSWDSPQQIARTTFSIDRIRSGNRVSTGAWDNPTSSPCIEVDGIFLQCSVECSGLQSNVLDPEGWVPAVETAFNGSISLEAVEKTIRCSFYGTTLSFSWYLNALNQILESTFCIYLASRHFCCYTNTFTNLWKNPSILYCIASENCYGEFTCLLQTIWDHGIERYKSSILGCLHGCTW